MNAVVEDKMGEKAPPGGAGPPIAPEVSQSILDLCDILLRWIAAMPAENPDPPAVAALHAIKARFLVVSQ
jgi:hypothetical protein